MAKSPKSSEFPIVDKFKYGYRNLEDVTNLPPGVLIVGSQNVLTNVSERVQIRQGYSVDGVESSVAGPVLASFDWLTRGNGERHMRAGSLTSAGNDGKLQYRYVDAGGAVTWRDLTIGLTTVAYNFTSFWKISELLRVALFVNGTSNIFEWNGALTEVGSTTANTITKTGTNTWADEGFYTSGNKIVIINGTAYTYTGGEGTTTLTGVTPDPSGEANGSVVHQAVITTANSGMTDIPSTFKNGLISTMNNQVYIGSLLSSALYLSKVNSYTDYSQSTPRQEGEGGTLVLDGTLTGFIVQGAQDAPAMYVTAGQDLWYKSTFTDYVSVSGSSGQTFGMVLIKTGRRQGPQSQAYLGNMKNNIITLTFEPTVDTVGLAENFFTQAQQTNLSDPIKLDMDQYDFTDGSVFYWRYYILLAVPKEGLVRVYNLNTNNWEAPQTLPVSRFYIVNGELYGHGYNTFESYKLFDGYADRVYGDFGGFPIQATWVFSYENYGSRYSLKKATKAYFEGYINANTMLTATLTYELDGCKTIKTFSLNGGDGQFVCLSTSGGGSLGKVPLGEGKLGGDSTESINGLPPKFRWFPTFTNTDFFEVSVSLSVLGVDNRAELLAFGLATGQSSEIPVQKVA